MASTIYVDWATGNDANNGLTPGTAKKTIVGAEAVITAGDLVLIEPGVYYEADHFFSSAQNNGTVYRANPASAGKVIVDFQNRTPTQLSENGLAHWRMYTNQVWVGVHFRNAGNTASHAMISNFESATGPTFIHCVFHQRDGAAVTGRALSGGDATSDLLTAINCTFYNFGEAAYSLNRAGWRNNYFVSCTTIWSFVTGTADYNAYPGNSEANGINTSVGANPGLVDTTVGVDDFRLDPTTVPADYVTFMGAGEFGTRIGAFGVPGIYYNAAYPQLRMLSPDPSSANGNPGLEWENEGPNGSNTYTDGTPGDIIENVTTKELEIDLGTTPGATGGRVRSEVYDASAAGSPRLESIAIGRSEDLPSGAAVDTNTTLPQQIEYRSSNTTFAKGDPTPTWTAADIGAHLNQAHRYQQIRITLRTDHTNA